MSWLDIILPPKIKKSNPSTKNSGIPEGLWLKCPSCEEVLYQPDLVKNFQVCPKCDHHFSVGARERLEMMLDEKGRTEIGADVKPVDILKFKDSKKYTDRLKAAKKDTGEDDALVVMKGKIHGIPVVVAAFEFRFIAGSMGSVVGERFVRGVKTAVKQGCPFISVAASGGARMQEGLTSLFQMGKTSAVLQLLTDHKLPYISVLTNPTMGGVSASFGFLGDIVLAEPNALVGFAGPRVIEQTVRETLPDGFQRSEFLLQKGAIDSIVDRREMRRRIASYITMMMHEAAIEEEA